MFVMASGGARFGVAVSQDPIVSFRFASVPVFRPVVIDGLNSCLVLLLELWIALVAVGLSGLVRDALSMLLRPAGPQKLHYS